MINSQGQAAITVKKSDLLETMRINRSKHEEEYKTAITGYHAAVTEELRRMLSNAVEGKKFALNVALPDDEPEDHTRDYTRVIRMLEMMVGEEVTITEGDFSRYVLDEWTWKGKFSTSLESYSAAAARASR